MEITCPACGKNNDLQSAKACSRCACDLSQLEQIMAGAVWHLKAAAEQLRAGDYEAALEQAGKSWQLHHSPRSAQVGCLAAMSLGLTDDAFLWKNRASADFSKT